MRLILAGACAGLLYGENLEDPVARSLLPEYKFIPAADPSELTPAAEISMAPFSSWTRSQGDNGSRRYSALKQINRENVRSLEVAWIHRSGDGAENIQCTPIIVDGTMYAPTPGRAIVAVDATTGVEKWRIQLENSGRNAQEDQPARRGLIYWPGDQENAPRILFGASESLYAADPQTGRLLPEFGESGRTAIDTGATTSGAIYQHVFVTTGRHGDVFGYDVRNGRLLWRFASVVRRGEFGAESWDRPESRANGWGGLSIDDQRGMVFIAIGAPHPNMVGIHRPGDNLFSNCILALDALTGRYRWHFQDIRHDIWDLDVTGLPNLVTIVRDGRRVDAVTGFSKGGHLLLLDRTSGKPIFPFRLRRAPVSKLPGEQTSPYQPDPILPEPISRMEFNPLEITDRTPEAHAHVQALVQRSNYGFFEPFTEGVSTLFIGTRGGAEWSGAAVDVPTGRLYVTSNRWVSRITVIPNDERERDPKYPPSAGEAVYAQHCATCHGPTRLGFGATPPLIGLKNRSNDAKVLELLRVGTGGMPPNTALDASQRRELLDFLFRRNQPPSRGMTNREDSATKYTFDGFNFLTDHEGYPGIKPPWGLLNCYDLSTGKALWRVPLGEHEELTRQGVPKTGSQNLGGATVTAGGLVFCAGTRDEKLRAFDAETGEELWAAKLPHAGTAAPAVYEVDGRQYVIITATGGGRVGGASGPGDAYVAFALKESKPE